jgi:hypothetical protein
MLWGHDVKLFDRARPLGIVRIPALSSYPGGALSKQFTFEYESGPGPAPYAGTARARAPALRGQGVRCRLRHIPPLECQPMPDLVLRDAWPPREVGCRDTGRPLCAMPALPVSGNGEGF